MIETKTITFRNKDAENDVSIPAVENEVKAVVKARVERTTSVQLHVIADGDLVSGTDTIPIENVTWQAAGEGFIAAVLSKSTPQCAGSWTGSGIREGAFQYYLENSWPYAAGDY